MAPSHEKPESVVDLSAYSPTNYDPGPFWKRGLWLIISRIFFETRFPWPSSLKSAILRTFGATIGKGVVWKPSVKIKYPWFLQTGDHCWIGETVWIDNLAQVVIEDHVVLSQGVYLLTGNHDYKSRTFDLRIGPISIASGAWIAAKAIVCPNVKVGRMAVLTVGSSACSDLDAFGIYMGLPARKVREREITVSDTE